MDGTEWIQACARRLQQQWPAVDTADLEEIARDLHEQPKWQGLAPQQAALQWLRQGIPTAA